jgi:hypothetical protein
LNVTTFPSGKAIFATVPSSLSTGIVAGLTDITGVEPDAGASVGAPAGDRAARAAAVADSGVVVAAVGVVAVVAVVVVVVESVPAPSQASTGSIAARAKHKLVR